MFAVGISSAVTLFLAYPPHDGRSAVEIIRTAGTIAVGTGGAAGLLLAARRQQKTEEYNAYTRHDAEERRISDLQASAGEQLGSEKAAVRLNGLYQLERLGQNHPEQRQTVVNVICAYLRMPFPDPPTTTPSNRPIEPSSENSNDSTYLHEEIQVRLTAQTILSDHLKPGAGKKDGNRFWKNIELNLTGATLINFDISQSEIESCRFDYAHFYGATRFRQTKFRGPAGFSDTKFSGQAWFNGAEFYKLVEFSSSEFMGMASFDRAYFKGETGFGFSCFHGIAGFSEAYFQDSTWFGDAEFEGGVSLNGARRAADENIKNDVWPTGWTTLAPESEGCVPPGDDSGGWVHLAQIDN
ncbi:Pentapeptide repeat-containing protein [Saccharopolyspora flava]|uniref:Pentapeptide repeat-containing protein n=2 Tax=Saccharopolyspora flava TaxID=95161 RepID=A0A1I6V7I3_9PSEU|nr:Pentapeptide repeat-containing protein [Saccharopolyspora flava]